jgi:iron complex outermembrane receptor protein
MTVGTTRARLLRLMALTAAGLVPGLAAAAEPVSVLGEVVVTAQRRSELNQNVPITINSIDRKQIEQANITKLSDITRVAPAVRMDYQSNFAQPYIRGIGSNIVATGSGPNVGLYVDGFYLPNPLATDFQLLNVESVQVLKGPQGTLFGRNTTGGAILVTTTEPKVEPSGVVEASYGSYNTQRYQGYATGGTGKFAFDIGGIYARGDGYTHNIISGSDKVGKYKNWSFRTGARAQVTDNFSLLLRYAHSSVNDPSALLTEAYVANGVPQVFGAVLPGVIIATKPFDAAQTKPVSFVLKTDSIQLTARLDLDFATLTSYTQHRKDSSITSQDIDFTAAPIFDVTYHSVDEVFSQELILTSKAGPRFQWTAGAFYLDYTNRFPYTLGSRGGGAPGVINNTYATTRSLAAYFDGTYQLTDKLFLTAGLRYTHDEIVDGRYFAGPLGGGPKTIFYPTLKNNRVTPRLAVRYALDDKSSLYGSFTEGYKAGIINMSGPADRIIKPEKIYAFEVGYKRATRNMTLDLSGFYYDYKNLQSAIIIPGGQNIYSNAASSRIYGVEGQFRYSLTPELEFNSAASYLNAKYRSFPSAIGFAQCLVPATCGASYGQFLQAPLDASGFDMARAPEFSGNAGLRYTTGLKGGELALSGNLYFTSKFYFDNSQQFPQKAYSTLTLRVEWTDPSSRYTFAIYGDNVTDTKYHRFISPSGLGVSTVYAPPATVAASVRARF